MEKLFQTALETCFHWILTEIRTFANFHFGSLTLLFPVTQTWFFLFWIHFFRKYRFSRTERVK